MGLIDSYAFNGLAIEMHGQWSSTAPHPHLAMNTPTTLRILGGGAAVGPTAAGSFLTASYPVSGYEWDAKGKDHGVPSPAALFVCCIAAAIPPQDYSITQATSPAPVNHPTAEASLPPEFVLVGGGARA